MIKLRRYIKPYLLPLALAIATLFLQAMSDLNLPNLMSQIVNVGIQQSGIEYAAPEAISAESYHLITFFMTDEEKTLVAASYEEVDDQSQLQAYPQAKSSVFLKKMPVASETVQPLENAFNLSTWTLINTLRALPGGDGQSAAAADLSTVSMDSLHALLPLLAGLQPAEITTAREMAAALPDSTREQTAAAFAKGYAQELGVNVEAIQQNYIIGTGIKMLLLTFVGAAATIIVGLMASRTAAGVSKDLRRDIFAKVESFSLSEFDQFSSASLVTRTTNDITQIQTLLVMAVRMIFYSPIMLVGGVILIAQTNPSMTWIVGVIAAVLIALFTTIYFLVVPKFKLQQKLTDKINLIARENLTGQMVIRAFSTQSFEGERFGAANKDLAATNRYVGQIISILFPIVFLLLNLTTVLIVWVGAHQIAQATMQVGDMMAFIQYAVQIIFSFLMIAMMFIMVPRASVSAGRIAEVLATEPLIRDPENPKPFEADKTGLVEFKEVSFRYPGAEENALHRISFTAKPGQVTAFIGSTGSGKSTLLHLIPRLYDVTEGAVLVGGMDVRDVTQKDLRHAIGFVSQKAILLSGTIASNLRYGQPDASDSDVRQAATIAQSLDFIEAKEKGFDDPITEGATNVSGGQKQRLAIARALAKKAPIYLFDDSFSALDFKTDSALRGALKTHAAQSTLLIVAQRVSTIMQADQIIVLNEGQIVGKGTHAKLLETCPTYYEIATSQLEKEELS